MLTQHKQWQALLIGLCALGLSMTSYARKGGDDDDYKPAPRKYENGSSLKNPKYTEPAPRENRKIDKPSLKQQHKARTEDRKEGKSRKYYQRREEPRKDRLQNRTDRRHENRERRDDRARPPTHTQRGLWPYPERGSLPAHRTRERSSHDRHYDKYSIKLRAAQHYRNHENYRYHTHYIAPIKHHYHPHGYRINVLPRHYLRLVILGVPYFYFSGVYYQHYASGGYIVVGAPIGAVVHDLPIGFISFGIGPFTYYYVNDTYYRWDDGRAAYIVVSKPQGADQAMTSATAGRLFVYPNHGQSEEQQARDRYECHRWAVSETGIDPSIEDPDDINQKEESDYKRAITACLEGRGYTVK